MIGPVDSQCAKALCQHHREVRLPATVDEARVFYNLCMDRVHYFPQRSAIYFVDSGYVAVAAIIQSVFNGLRRPLQIDQLYLDNLSIFKSLKRVRMEAQEAVVVLAALPLAGIQISISE